MKLIFKLMLLALLLIGISPFLLHDTRGKPLLSLDKLLPEKLAHLFDRTDSTPLSTTLDDIRSTANNAAPRLNNSNTTVHKWQDKRGIWHFSDKRNPNGKDDVVLINANTNLVQGDPVAKDVPAKKEDTKNNGQASSLPMTIPMKDVPKLISDTQLLRDTMNKHYKTQQKLLDSIQSNK